MNERSVLLPILLSGSLKLPLPPRPRKPSSPCDGVEHPSDRVFISDSTSKLRLHHIPGDMPLHKDTVLPGLRAAAQVCPKCVERVLTKHQASQEEQGCPCSPQRILPGELLAAVSYILHFERLFLRTIQALVLIFS